MTTHGTPAKVRVRLKRVVALDRADQIIPGKGLFRRDGSRIENQSEMTAAWGTDTYTVTSRAWMNDIPEMNVALIIGEDEASQSILHTPLDAYVVLA